VRRFAWVLVATSLAIYTLTTYGGTRSPDSEVVYRTAEALAERGTFAVNRDLETWRGFGLAEGRDGGRYSVFGPLEPILLVPFVELADLVNRTGWYEHVPVAPSHYYGKGVYHAIFGTQPSDREPHAARMIASLFNVIVTALCVLAFYALALAVVENAAAGFGIALLFAFGTPIWSYSGTFFSEPLAILFVLLSLRWLVMASRAKESARLWRWLLSGAMLGLAVTAHISMVLFAPFFLLFGYLELRGQSAPAAAQLRALGAFAAGLVVFLLLLGLYDHLRFGSPFETGRGVASQAKITLYGTFTWPWAGLRGLLAGPSKGLILFAPVVVAGLILWPQFHRRHRNLSIALGSAAAFRLIFIASRTDWHGGWCLGPRLLLVLVPLLLLPLGSWLAEAFVERRRRAVQLFMALSLVAFAQQLYFALGELFSFWRASLMVAQAKRIDFDLSTDWAYSPLLHSLDWNCGPYLLGRLPLDTTTIWAIGTFAALVGCLVWARVIGKRLRESA